MAPFDDVGYTDPATGINYPPPSQTMSSKAKSPIPGLGNYPNYSASTQQYINNNPAPSNGGIPIMTAAMLGPLHNVSQVSQTPSAVTPKSTAYSPTNPHHLPARSTGIPFSFSIRSKNNAKTPPPPMQVTKNTTSSPPKSTAPSFVPLNNGGSFSFIPSTAHSTTPAANPYAGMNTGMSSWTMAHDSVSAKPSSGRPRSDWRTGKGAAPSDVFAANLFPGLAKIPQFGQTSTPGQNLFGPAASQTMAAANQATPSSRPSDDTTMEEATAAPAQVLSQPTIEGPSVEMGETPSMEAEVEVMAGGASGSGSGAGFMFSAQARLNPGRSTVSKFEKSRSSRNRAGRQGLSFGSPTSKLAAPSFALQGNQFAIDPQLTVQSLPLAPAALFIGPQLSVQSVPPPPPPPPPSDPFIDPQLMEQPPPPPASPPSAFIGPQLPVQSAPQASTSNVSIVPQSLEQQITAEEMTIANIKSQHQKEQEAIQGQLLQMKTEVEQSKKEQSQLQTQLSNSKADLEKSQKQQMMLQTQLSRSTAELEQSRKQQTELQTQVSNMTTATEQSQLMQADLQAQVSILQGCVEQYQSQTQEIVDLKATLATEDRPPGKYDWVKDNTISHQRIEIESLTKQRNFHRKTADELQNGRKVALRSQREFRVLLDKIKTLEDEKTSWQRKYEKGVEDTARRVEKIEARSEEKREKLEQSMQSLRKQLREAETEDNRVRAEEAEKKNAELLEEIRVLKRSNAEARAAAKGAEEKTKEVKGHNEEERKTLIKSYDSELAEKSMFIFEKETLVSKKNEKIVELHGIMEKKDQLLEALDADTVSRKNAEIVELKIMMKERERVVETLEADLRTRNTQIVELKSQKAQLRNELRDKFTPKLERILMTPIEPLPTLKNTSLPPTLVKKLTAMVAEDNAANPLSISKMMVTEIEPVMEETVLEESKKENEVHNKSGVEATNDEKNEQDETFNDSKTLGQVVTSAVKTDWTRSLAFFERIIFFIMGVLMVYITSAVVGFYSGNQMPNTTDLVSAQVASLIEHEIRFTDVISREDNGEVSVFNLRKLDLPFETTESAEYIDIIVDIADILDDLFKEFESHILDDTYEPETGLEMESYPKSSTEGNAESEDSTADGVDQAYELKLDLMFVGAGVVVCVFMSSFLILERGL